MVTGSSRRGGGQPFSMQPVLFWQSSRPAVVLPSPAPTSARALWVSSVFSAAWRLLQ